MWATRDRVMSDAGGAAGTGALEFAITLAAYALLLAPVGTIGLTGSYILLAISLLVLALAFGVRVEGFVAAAVLMLLGLFLIDLVARGVGWHSREYIIVMTWGLLFIRFPRVNLQVFLRSILLVGGGVIAVDFVSLYLKWTPWLADQIRDLTFSGEIRELWDGYWRHAGIRGNPNKSGFFYGIFLVIYAFAATQGRVLSRASGLRLSNVMVHVSAVAAVVLLAATESRTNILATAVLAGVSALSIPYARIRYLVIIAIGALVLVVSASVDTLRDRFASFSSAEARIRHWEAMVNTMDGLDMLVGRPLPFSYTDSDYIYIFTRFGVLGSLAVVVLLIWLLRKADRSSVQGRLAVQIFLYAVLAGTAMGIFVSPNDAAFVLILFLVLVGGQSVGANCATSR